MIMLVDIVCGSILVIFTILGAVRGFVSQAFSLAAFILIAIFGVPLGVRMAEAMAEGQGWSRKTEMDAKIGMSFVAAFAIYAVVKLVGVLVNRGIGKRHAEAGERGLAPWNRYWGAALGLVKAGVVCWLVLCFLVAFPRIAPTMTDRAERSWSAKTTGAFNPFVRWIEPATRSDLEEAMIALWKLKRHPAAWGEVIREESIQRVIQHERVSKLLDEGRGDVLSAVEDEDFQKSVSEVDWANVAETAKRALAEAEAEEK